MGYIQAKQVAPQEVAEAERTWDMDFAAETIDETAEICRRRLEYARTLLGQASALRERAGLHYGAELPPVDFGALLAQVKPSMLVGEADHLANVRWFAELLKTDEGQSMKDEERMLVQAFIEAEALFAKEQAAAVAQAQSEVAGAAGADRQSAIGGVQ
jgi:hypothetical protein